MSRYAQLTVTDLHMTHIPHTFIMLGFLDIYTRCWFSNCVHRIFSLSVVQDMFCVV